MTQEFNPPEAIKNLKQWHHWQLVGDRKVPKQISGENAKPNDSSTWTDLLTAVSTLDGDRKLAFTLGDGCRTVFLIGIDLDDCFEEDGTLRPWADEIYSATADEAYWEYSPSGTGVKGLVMGTKPDHLTRCQFPQGEGKQCVEIYDSNRFWAFTGEVITDHLPTSQQETSRYVLDMLAMLESREQSRRIAEKASRTPRKPSGSKTGQISRVIDKTSQEASQSLSRARAYIATIPHAEGSRNNNLYQIAHQCRAFGLDKAMTYKLCNEWNDSGANPMDPNEVDSCIESALRGVPFEPMEDRELASIPSAFPMPWEASYEPGPDEEQSEIVQEYLEAQEAADHKKISEEHRIDWMGLTEGYGFLHYMAERSIEANYEYRPEFGLSAAFTVLAAACGRGWCLDDRHKTNGRLYSITVGATGGGKGTVFDLTHEWLERSQMSSLGVGITRSVDGSVQFKKELLHSATTCFLLDEFAETLSKYHPGMSGPVPRLVATMKEAFTMEDVWNARAETGRDARMTIYNATPIVNAVMTPKGLDSCVTEIAVESGMLGRFVVFNGVDDPGVSEDDDFDVDHTYPEEQLDDAAKRLRTMFRAGSGSITSGFGGKNCPIKAAMPSVLAAFAEQNVECTGVSQDVYESIVQTFNKSSNSGQKVKRQVIPYDQDARDLLSQHFKEIKKRTIADRNNLSKEVDTAIWSRATEKYAKFALLFCVARHVWTGVALRVTLEDAEAAIAFVKALTKSFVSTIKHAEATEHAKLQRRIYDAVREGGNKGMLVSKVISATKQYEPFRRNNAIEDLLKSKVLIAYTSAGGAEYLTTQVPDEKYLPKK